jgi:hypothetical protein
LGHYIFAVEGYHDAHEKLVKNFHHRSYKNGKAHSRVREVRLYDFTIEEAGEAEFIADLRGWLNNDLREVWDHPKKSFGQRLKTLDFWPLNAKKLEIKYGDNKHFKKYIVWSIIRRLLSPLKLFGVEFPEFKHRSYLREQMEADGEYMLMQGFFVCKLRDRKDGTWEHL